MRVVKSICSLNFSTLLTCDTIPQKINGKNTTVNIEQIEITARIQELDYWSHLWWTIILFRECGSILYL